MGRLVTVSFCGRKTYVTLSESSLMGRNSSIQSVPTAFNIFCADATQDKELCYYFLEHKGNAFTEYHIFMYRLMVTAGIRFLNVEEHFGQGILPFHNVDELIEAKRILRQSKTGNNSSFVTRSARGVQVYAKVYGASKYESTLLAYATSCISPNPVDLYNICEQNLQTLPKSSLKTLEALNIRVHNTNLFFDANHQGELQNEDLRASAYIYNLLKRLGDKKCALCDCCVPEIIQYKGHTFGACLVLKVPISSRKQSLWRRPMGVMVSGYARTTISYLTRTFSLSQIQER